jgi:hypothetical protein
VVLHKLLARAEFSGAFESALTLRALRSEVSAASGFKKKEAIPMLHPTREDKGSNLNTTDPTDGHPVQDVARRPVRKPSQGDDSATEQQIIDMISEGCPNSQGY